MISFHLSRDILLSFLLDIRSGFGWSGLPRRAAVATLYTSNCVYISVPLGAGLSRSTGQVRARRGSAGGWGEGGEGGWSVALPQTPGHTNSQMAAAAAVAGVPPLLPVPLGRRGRPVPRCSTSTRQRNDNYEQYSLFSSSFLIYFISNCIGIVRPPSSSCISSAKLI